MIVAAALGLGGASVRAHRVSAAPAQTPSALSSSTAPNSGYPLAGGGALDPTSPLPPTSSPSGPGRAPQPTPGVPSVPSAPQLAADGIPAVALDAYRKAAAEVAAKYPGCGLPWPLLAAIGRVESDHGRFGGSQIYANGTDAPRVIGIPLNGHGTALVRDTDHGRLDGDTVYDHAVGPMQFIPSTWATWGVDGNGDGVASPFNIYDAALAAADYLCAAGGNLQTAAGQIRAVLAYNDSDAYLATVLALEKLYAAGQPGVTIPILPAVPMPPAHEKPLPPPVNPGPPLALTPPSTSQPGTGPGSSGPGSTSRPGSPSGPGSTSSPGSPSGPGSTPSQGSPGAPPTWSRTSPPGSAPPASSSSPAPPADTPPTADLAVAPTSGGGPLDVTADASKSTDDKSGLTYTFDFGDSTAAVGPQAAPTATHTYQAAGTYTVKVTVTDSAGQTSTKSVDITVTAPSAASAATSGVSSAATTGGSSSAPTP